MSCLRSRPSTPGRYFRLAELRVIMDLKAYPFSVLERTNPKTREVLDEGTTWKEYEWTFRSSRSDEPSGRIRLRVDLQTGLLKSWDTESENGASVHREFDYPEAGPADVLALGVPASARRVDRVPGDDLNRVLTGLQIGRNRFDDYCGYVWFDGTVERIWRKGRQWRVDYGTSTKTDGFKSRRPDNAGLGWWRQHETDYVFAPQAICDGLTMWFYTYPPHTMEPGKPYLPPQPKVSSQPVFGPDDDPMMPWPHLMPEQIAHRSVFLPATDREFLLEPKPGEGPPNTVRLRVRDSKSDDPNRPDLYRLWVDPEKNYLAIRTETCVFEPRTDSHHGPSKIAYVDTQILKELARSPSGFWYPIQVLRQTSTSDHKSVTQFVLDFHVTFPDRLFEPLKQP
jgi:hypothetical protein